MVQVQLQSNALTPVSTPGQQGQHGGGTYVDKPKSVVKKTTVAKHAANRPAHRDKRLDKKPVEGIIYIPVSSRCKEEDVPRMGGR
jgi:hypothetical protein